MKLPRDYRLSIWGRSGGRCWYCGTAIDPDDRDNFHADHVTPKSKGGKGVRGNLVPSCRSCNLSKKNKDLEGYRVSKQWKRDGIPYFTPTQIAWLADNGFEFDCGDPWVFWFEQEGLLL